MRKVKVRCQAALAQAPEKRAAYLVRACPDDPLLRGQVEALLSRESAAVTPDGKRPSHG